MVEAAPLSYQSSHWSNVASQSSAGWGSTPLTVGGDVRIAAGLEAGLSVSYLLGHSESEQTFTGAGTEDTLHTTATQSSFAATPRVSYRIPLTDGVALVPRVGARFTHSNVRQSMHTTSGALVPDSDVTSSSTWGVAGALLELDLAGPIFAAVGPEFSVRLGGSTEQSASGAPPASPGLPDPSAWQLVLVLGIGTHF